MTALTVDDALGLADRAEELGKLRALLAEATAVEKTAASKRAAAVAGLQAADADLSRRTGERAQLAAGVAALEGELAAANRRSSLQNLVRRARS
jgi:hypothetical protein